MSRYESLLEEARKKDKIAVCKLKYSNRKKKLKYRGEELQAKFEDIEFPDVCPILGIPLDYDMIEQSDYSPCFDRYDTSKGWVKGNIIIISLRASLIKRYGNSEELKKVAKFLKRYSNN